MAIAFKHLTKRADGRTHIVGRRLTPYDMLCQYELGLDPEKLAEEYDLSMAEVYEALAYAFDHSDEMAALREYNRSAARDSLKYVPEHLREAARQGIERDKQAYEEAANRARERRRGALVS